MSTGKPIRSGQYRPDDYKFVSVPEEVSKLWEDILSYTAKEIELELPLKCFIPDYIPTTGDCEFMLKVSNSSFFPCNNNSTCVANAPFK
jgi:hypothetical protein